MTAKRRTEKSTKVQSLLFSRKEWTAKRATNWAKAHGYGASKVHSTEKHHRIRQAPPEAFSQKTLRTIQFGKGVAAVVGRPWRANSRNTALREGTGEDYLKIGHRGANAVTAWMLLPGRGLVTATGWPDDILHGFDALEITGLPLASGRLDHGTGRMSFSIGYAAKGDGYEPARVTERQLDSIVSQVEREAGVDAKEVVVVGRLHGADWTRVNPEIDQGEPSRLALDLNMTRGLKFEPGATAQESMRGLVPGFHLNTITGRLFHHWAPTRFPESRKPKKQWTSAKDEFKDSTGPNARYWAAYAIWRDYIANAVWRMPKVRGVNRNTGREVDVLRTTKALLDDPGLKYGPVASLLKAYEVEKSVFGQMRAGMSPRIRDYGNWLEVAAQGFFSNSSQREYALQEADAMYAREDASRKSQRSRRGP